MTLIFDGNYAIRSLFAARWYMSKGIEFEYIGNNDFVIIFSI